MMLPIIVSKLRSISALLELIIFLLWPLMENNGLPRPVVDLGAKSTPLHSLSIRPQCVHYPPTYNLISSMYSLHLLSRHMRT